MKPKLFLFILKIPLLCLLFQSLNGLILSGGPNSYARYPKWAHSYENSLSLELKTKQSDGLLLYTDDGGINGNFYALTIADGKIQLDFRLGDNANEPGKRPVNTIRIEDVRVDDDRWHTLSIFQSWENVKIELDQTTAFRILYQRSFVFGNLLKNSDVFIGGLPKDLHMLPTMSSPLRRHTRHLAVNVRNLLYRLYPQGVPIAEEMPWNVSQSGVTSPQLLEAFGTRQNDEDHCKGSLNSYRESFVCQNQGTCYSTNDGPKCDCSATDHEGPKCESERPDGELSFFGQEWVGYDVSNFTSAPIRTKRETIHLLFKTVHGEALLFFAGDDSNFLQISIEDGSVHAYSKFEGTEQRMVRMFNSINQGRYDDDLWHSIVVDRSLHMLVLTVDGQRDEIRQYAPETDWIGNSFAFVGGIPREKMPREGGRSKSFRGCMRQIKYEADAQQVIFVNLADEGFGESVIRTGGELAFSCKNPQVPPDVLSFNTSDSFIALPKWNSLASGSISFHFRTSEPDGLLLYHGDVASSSDFVAFELIDGHLFFVIDLGSGHVRLQTTSKRVTDSPSQWHSVLFERVGRTGNVVVDSVKTDFNTPGVSANLIVDDPVYLGALPFDLNAKRKFPSSVWSITLRKGFVGCIKNVRFNGISAKISTIFEQQNPKGISMGCTNSHKIDFCEGNPCQNFARCESGFAGFHCDCSSTGMEGATCSEEPLIASLTGDRPLSVVLPSVMASEAESIEFRFKTDTPRGILLDTRSVSNRTHRLVVNLSSGELELFFNFGSGKHTFNWGRGLHDNRWHEARMKRRGERLLLYLDGKWEHSYFLPSHDLVLEVDELSLGQSIHTDSGEEPFRGQMTSAKFNHLDLLTILRKENKLLGTTSSKESKGQRNIKTKSPAVSFTNTTGYVTFSAHRVSRIRGDFRVSFKFQTLSRNALLFATSSIDTQLDSILVELIHGRIRYTYRTGLREESATSPTLPFGNHLSDLRWHTLLIYQDPKTGEHNLIVDNTTSVLTKLKHHRAVLTGTAFLAGIPPSSPVSGRLATARGLRGCISGLRLGDEVFDILDEADKLNLVVRGCQGPLAKCSPGACSNNGRCIQQWNSIRCDCSLTAHAGDRCNQPATTYTFSKDPSVIFYEYSENERPSTEKDYAVLAFKTIANDGVLLSIECLADRDYLALFLQNGLLVVRFNLGSVDHFLPLSNVAMNDGAVHVVKLFRADANITAIIDKYPPIRYRPEKGEDLVTLNMQWRISIGAALNAKHLLNNDRMKRHLIKIIAPFEGDIGGVNFNGLSILDLHAQGHPNVRAVGGVKLLYQAPQKMQSSAEDIDGDGIEPSPFFEAIAPSCLTVDEQERCFTDPEPIGFFTPQLPTAVTASRQRVHPTTPSLGEYPRDPWRIDQDNQRKNHHFAPPLPPPPPPTTPPTTTRRTTTTTPATTTTTTTTRRTTTPTTTMKTTTTESVYLADFFVEEGSADFPESQENSVETVKSPNNANPLMATVRTTVSTMATTRKQQLPISFKSTVLPRPYENMNEAILLNPDYASSIWQQAMEAPDIGPTGPAWLGATRNRSRATTRRTERPREMSTRRPAPTIGNKERSTPSPQFLIETTARVSPFTVYPPVRPTTPMGTDPLGTTTMKPASGEDFPRTMLIMVGSGTVIVLIAAIVFCVFKCRQNAPPSEHYPMVMNGKSTGYAPISQEMSPQMIHHGDPSTQPLIAPRINTQVNGYQPIKGSVIPNGMNGDSPNGTPGGGGGMNGVNGMNGTGPRRINGGMNGSMNGLNGATNGNGPKATAKKKDFKEWYV